MSTGFTRATSLGRKAVYAAVVLVVVAAGFAAWFGVSWFTAANDGSAEYSRTREEVRAVGAAAVKTLTTLDYQNAAAGLQDWINVSTGSVRNEFTQNKAQYQQALEAAKTKTTARVLDSAVTDLNLQQHTAKIIAAVEATVTQDGQQPATKRMRLEAELTQADGTWKVVQVAQVDYQQPSS